MDASGASMESRVPGAFDVDWGEDVLWINSTFHTDNIPLGLCQSTTSISYMNDSPLGLNSTVINALMQSSAISSTVWSLWQGLMGAEIENQMEGSLILGGYDAAKAVGDNVTTSLDLDSAAGNLVVNITGLVVNFANGTNKTIIGTASNPQYFAAALNSAAPFITLPIDVYNSFSQNAGGTLLSHNGNVHPGCPVYAANGVFTGDLTFTIDSKPEIRIPNHQLVLPDYEIGENGKQYITNHTIADVLLKAVNDSDAAYIEGEDGGLAILGQPFLTSALLMVHPARKEFVLWQSNPTVEQEIIAITSTSNCKNPTTSIGSNATNIQLGISSLSTRTSHRLSTGAIAEIAIGGVAFVLVVILLLDCCQIAANVELRYLGGERHRHHRHRRLIQENQNWTTALSQSLYNLNILWSLVVYLLRNLRRQVYLEPN